MAKMFNRARMTVTSTGTGALSLGVAVAGYQTFSSAGAQNGDSVSYAIEDGLKWEIGTGTYNSVAGTLSRTVTQSFDGTTYGTSPISVTTSAQVFISPLAADLQYGTSAGNLVQLDGSARLPAVDGSLVTALNASNISSGTLGVARGGTGLTSLTAGRIPFGAGVSGTDPFGNNSYFTYSTSNGFQISSPAATSRLISANSAYDRADISLINGPTYAIRFGTSASGSQIEGVDYTGSTSYQPISLGGSLIQFTISGPEKMRIASDGAVGIGYTTTSGIGANGLGVLGNVGIGTASPSGKFTVSGGRSHFVANSEIYALSVGYASIGAYYLGANSANNSLLISNSGGTTVATFDNAGNLGLGVTPSAWGSGFKAIDLGNSSAIYRGGSAETGFTFNSYYNGTNYTYKLSAAASVYEQVSGAHKWYNAPSGTAGNPITFTQAMTLDASGNLGIGTTSPSVNLEVKSPSGTSEIRVTDSAGDIFQIQSSSTEARFGSIASVPLTFRTANTERARIDSSGNLLVGTASNASGAAKALLVGPVTTASGLRVSQISAEETNTTVNSSTYNVTFNNSCKVFAVTLSSGDGALIVTSYISSIITIVNSTTSGNIVASASPTASQLGISKSANSHVVTFKTGSSAASTFGVWQVIGLTTSAA